MSEPVPAAGQRVEVRSRFDGRWTRGFELEAEVDGGITVRRLSDDTVLPVVFSPDEVRPERHHRSMWWA